MRLSAVQRTADGACAFVEDVGVYHGGGDVFVPKKVLDSADIVTAGQKMGGKAVAEGVGANMLVDADGSHGFFDGPLEAAFMEMVSASNARPGIDG